MRFPGSGAGLSTGWSSYSSDGDAERFQDEGRGTALLVSIEEAGAPPQIETIEVGRLRWSAEDRDLTSQPLGEMISAYAERENREVTLLRLTCPASWILRNIGESTPFSKRSCATAIARAQVLMPTRSSSSRIRSN